MTEHEALISGMRPNTVRTCIAEFGTPTFVYDCLVMNDRWSRLRSCLPSMIDICYSVKANPNPAIIELFLRKGSGVEIASGGEFLLALRAGCAAEKIVFAGPGKTAAELEYVLVNRIGEIHAESVREVEQIGAISRHLGVRAPTALRVNPSAEAQGGAMRMGGKASPFGIDEEALDEVVQRVVADPALEFRGLHLFSGTQILDHEVLLRQYRKGLDLSLKTARKLGRPLHTIDFGGGLGIPYSPNEKPLNMDALRQQLRSLMEEICREPMFDGTRFIIEPGRYLVGEAGVYVTRVIDKKVSRGKTFLIVDGGMHHHLAASGNLGQVIKRNFPVVILGKGPSGEHEKVDIVGPLCTPLDVLARDIELPKGDIGDLVAILQSGAYARTASPMEFLSHPTPPEVLIEDGGARLIRRRGTYQDQIRDLCEFDPHGPDD